MWKIIKQNNNKKYIVRWEIMYDSYNIHINSSMRRTRYVTIYKKNFFNFWREKSL